MFKTNSDYQKKLLKRWAPILEKGAAIDSVEKKLVMAQVLENTRKEFTKKGLFTEAAPANVQNIDGRGDAYTAPLQGQGVLTANDYILPNVVMPMLRRIFPTLMAHELVGVQAMTGPVGYVMALRAVAQNRGFEGYELGYGVRGRMNQSAFTGSKDICCEDTDSTMSQNALCTGKGMQYAGDAGEYGTLDDLNAFLGGPAGAAGGVCRAGAAAAAKGW